MNTSSTPKPAAGPQACLSNPCGLLFDLQRLDGLEWREAGWDEWERCVEDQELHLALLALRARAAH